MNATTYESPFRTNEGARWMNPMRAEAIFWALMQSGQRDTEFRFRVAKRWARRVQAQCSDPIKDRERYRAWGRRASYAALAWDRAVR